MATELKRNIDGVDWTALSELYRQTLGHDEPAQLQRTWSRSYATVLAYDGQRLAGAARAISDGEREALIIGVAVLPEYQRQGIGQEMMQDLLERLPGVAVILTCSEDENVPFYRGLGFRTHKRSMVLNYPAEVCLD